jgi:hypothetical protein
VFDAGVVHEQVLLSPPLPGNFTTCEDLPPGMDRVEWSRRPSDSRPFLVVVHLLAGALAAVVGVAGLLLVTTLWRLVAAGDHAMAGVLVVLTLVGGWASVAYLVPILSDPELRARLVADPVVEDLRPGWVLVGTVVVGGLVVAAVALGVPPRFVLFGALAPLALSASMLRQEGAVDVRGTKIQTRERTVPVDGLTGYRTLRLGDTVFVWLSYARGRGSLDAPRLLAVPAADAPDVRRALDVIADPAAEPDPADPGERWAVRVAAVVCLAGAAAAGIAPSVVDVPAAVMVAAVPLGVTGAVFLASAWLE